MNTSIRQLELDYLKGIFIILMVIFHLDYTATGYPMITKAVYSFHMPAFLIISGFLINLNKNLKAYCKGLLKIAIPYLFFEILYVVMLSFVGNKLHASNGSFELSLTTILESLFLNPKGLYWYLHTLILCSLSYYLISKLKFNSWGTLLLTGVAYFFLSDLILNFKFFNAIYFLIGAALGKLNQPFTSCFPKHPIIILPLVLLFSFESNLDRSTLGGITITFLMIGLCLWVYKYLPDKVSNLLNFLGRNSLVILCFSPIFTVGSKILAPFFQFDSSNVIAILVSVFITIVGCFLSGFFFDKIKLTNIIFRKPKLIA